MKLGEYYLDFEHQPDLGISRAFLSKEPNADPIDWVESSVYYTDRFSRKGGRRACMQKLLDPERGYFCGTVNRAVRKYLWEEYFKIMPQDKAEH